MNYMDEQITEIAKAIALVDATCPLQTIAEALYYEGYCKRSDVAREIIQKLEEYRYITLQIWKPGDPADDAYIIPGNVIAELKKEFNLEEVDFCQYKFIKAKTE